MTIHRRGKPDAGDVIHMHRKQDRPGLREGLDALSDYVMDGVCQPGSFHVFISDNEKQITCPRCIELVHSINGRMLRGLQMG